MWQDDPLFVTSSKRPCRKCSAASYDFEARRQKHSRKRRSLEKQSKARRKNCDRCMGAGFDPIDLAGIWSPQPAFLVCGGPSLSTLPLYRLRERGIASLAINNAAAYAPVKACTFGDPQFKFHGSTHLDPGVMTFCPTGKLHRSVRMKYCDTFRFTDIRMYECPSVYGVARSGQFDPQTFLTTYYAHWGHGGQGDKTRPFTRLATMLMGVRLLHYLGAPRVYMIGVDFKIEKNKPGYAWGDAASAGNQIWYKINTMLSELRDVFQDANYQLYNCNPESACTAFEFKSFDEALDDCKGPVQDEPLDLSDWYGSKRRERDHLANPHMLSRQEAIDMKRIDC